MAEVMIVCPTMKRAGIEYNNFLKKYGPIVFKANAFPKYRIVCQNGLCVIFMSENNPSELLGYRGKVMSIDTFLYNEKKYENFQLQQKYGRYGSDEFFKGRKVEGKYVHADCN